MSGGRTSPKVYLIGAGPGDPDLITLKAVKALQRADVVLIDDLVDRRLLAHASPDARVIGVGKRGGCKSTPQKFIERLMLRLVRSGKTVARLKGGDPFVFGRGGEEMQALGSAGIAVEVINGITAGIAVPATIGIPVTHRDFSRGVAFVSGHSSPNIAVNWRALIDTGMTLVIYMGMANLEAITTELLTAGMAPTTPACAIERGTHACQREVIGTLAMLAKKVAEARLSSPAVVVIGDVVRLAQVSSRDARLAAA